MKILISGGGTAGHINPALAIAAMYKKENENNIIEYVGTRHGLESKLVAREGIKMHYVDVSGFKRKITFENIKTAIKAVTSIVQARKIIKEFNPDVVIGTGGYVCWPVLKAASSMKIPAVIHEQNAFPGLTVKKLAPLVDRVLISFTQSEKYFDNTSNLVLTGNPIREEMLSIDKQAQRKAEGISPNATVVLAFGGSLGASKINENMFLLIRDYFDTNNAGDIVCYHATGTREWQMYKEKYLKCGFIEYGKNVLKKGNIIVSEYIYDMPQKLAVSDIVISRAGAMTLSELAALGKASIIIPSPNVTNNHQYKNAKVLSDANACIMLEEQDLNYVSLKASVESYHCDIDRRNTVENNIAKFAILDSLQRINTAVSGALAQRAAEKAYKENK